MSICEGCACKSCTQTENCVQCGCDECHDENFKTDGSEFLPDCDCWKDH